MAAIGRFQKGDDIFYAKVVDGELFRLHGDVDGVKWNRLSDHVGLAVRLLPLAGA